MCSIYVKVLFTVHRCENTRSNSRSNYDLSLFLLYQVAVVLPVYSAYSRVPNNWGFLNNRGRMEGGGRKFFWKLINDDATILVHVVLTRISQKRFRYFYRPICELLHLFCFPLLFCSRSFQGWIFNNRIFDIIRYWSVFSNSW